MCGIVGILNLDGRPVDRDLLARMNSTLAHRGPDGEGYFFDDGDGTSPACGLAQRRLAIIDVAGGKQPLGSEDGRVQVVVNGEFYNYRQLRRELKAQGHAFAAHTDSEVLVHLYEDLGTGAIERLRGMFACAVWDAGRRRLLLARDRMGQKPLYWTRLGDRLLFASEVKAFFADPDFERRLNTAALGRYLRWLYLPGDESLLAGVNRIRPGRLAVIDRTGMTERTYWSLPPFVADKPVNEAEAVEEFNRLLTEAVALRLMSEVPLGAFLSGGIDSSLICALMAKVGERPKTFTVSFGDRSFDESAPARRAAEHLGTEHTEVAVEPDVLADLEALIEALDEPMADSSAIPTYWLCKATRRHVTVALSGDGGDELLAGYRRYLGRRLAEGYNAVPGPIRTLIGGLAGSLPDPSAYSGKSLIKKFKMFVDQARQVERRPDASRLDFLTRSEIDEVLTPEVRRLAGFTDDPIAELFLAASPGDPVARMQWVDCLSYLPDDILVKVDRMSMANSLEVRSPMMDHPLIEFLASVPLELKLKGLTTKYLMKRLARRYLPAEIVTRPKQGFEVPLAAWFRGEMKGLLLDTAADPELERAGVFVPGALRRLAESHLSGRRDLAQVLWGVLVLELWLKRFKVATG